jgi:hypothetical protein
LAWRELAERFSAREAMSRSQDERARLSPSVLVGTLAAKKLLFLNVRCERLLGTLSGEKPCVINKQLHSF